MTTTSPQIFKLNDLIENPTLIYTYKIDVKQYPGLVNDACFHMGYIKMCIKNHKALDMSIIEHIPWTAVSQVFEDEGWVSGLHAENIVPLFKQYCDMQSFNRDTARSMSTILSSRYYLKSAFLILFRQSYQFREFAFQDPDYLLKAFNRDQLCQELLNSFSDIPDMLLDPQHDFWIKNVHQLNLSKMRVYNPDKCNQFFPLILRSPQVISNPKVADKDYHIDDGIMFCENTLHLNAFKLSDLSLENAFALYMKSVQYGIKVMLWVTPVSGQNSYIVIKESVLNSLKNELNERLTRALKMDVQTWYATHEDIAKNLYNTKSDIDVFCQKSFYTEIQQEEKLHEMTLLI